MKQERIQLKGIIAIVSTVFLVASAFFVSIGLTGLTISNFERQTANIIGAILFVVSLVGYYLYLRIR